MHPKSSEYQSMVDRLLAGESIGGDELTPAILAEMRADARNVIRVVFPMAAWNELEYLADDSTEDPTDLPSRVIRAWQADHGRFPDGTDDVSCEGEEEGEEWAFYVTGLPLGGLLTIVRQSIPDGWTATAVPVPADAFAGAQIAVVPR